ncbi:MAG: SDR family NAD(P)-dependent oxidoreductase [Bacteroidota bacterium]
MNFIITGGHSGIGLELTKTLLNEGHTVGLVVRNETRKQETEKLFDKNSLVSIFIADLSNRDHISSVANEISSKWENVDGLFNNAGLLLDKLYFSDYGNELQLEVNAISPYLLTKALKPLFDKTDHPFVVSTATGGLSNRKSIDIHSFKKPQKFTKLFGSYIDSKLTMVLLMNHLSENKEWSNIRLVCAYPGPIKTKMTSGDGMPFWLKPIRNLLFKSPEFGAQNLYDAALDPKYKESGVYLSEGKIKEMQVTIDQDEINQLLS